MTELSEALARGERVDGLSPAEQAAAEQSLHLSTCPITDCPRCDWELSRIRAVLKAAAAAIREQHLVDLSAAGRLLPEGATHRTEFVVRWYFAEEVFIEWGCDSRDLAHKAAKEPPERVKRGEIRSREHWAGPWSVVEPVAVKEASE